MKAAAAIYWKPRMAKSTHGMLSSPPVHFSVRWFRTIAGPFHPMFIRRTPLITATRPPGAVLIVGTGNSGCQIGDELLHSGRRVFLAISRHSRAPRRYRGKDVIWWYEKLGRFDVNIDTFPGRRYPPTSIMTGVNGGYDLDPRRLGSAGVSLLGRVLGINDGTLALADDAEQLLAAADQKATRPSLRRRTRWPPLRRCGPSSTRQKSQRHFLRSVSTVSAR